MRIYLDSNVFRILKDESNLNLLKLISENKKHNIYCYSEAHILDLLNDKTDNKFNDFAFMEKIVEDNFWCYNKKVTFKLYKPIEYYNSINHENSSSFEEMLDEDIWGADFKEIFKNIQLPFKELISQQPFPSDFPDNFKKILLESDNLYDFMNLFSNYSYELASSQPKFKEQLKYLKENSININIPKTLGIEGFENGILTDKIKFRESLINYFIKDKPETNKYFLFLNLYNSLEIMGFVNGKIKKQDLKSMINDGKHAFFASYCDIIVSEDKDFINKTKFIYELFDIKIDIFNVDEFKTWLHLSSKQNDLKYNDLISEIRKTNPNEHIIFNETLEDKRLLVYNLKYVYYSYFDIIGYVFSDKNNYIYFSKNYSNLSIGTFYKELKYVTNRLIEDLGVDINGELEFNQNEVINGDWKGRVWLINNIQINLSVKEKIFLSFYPDNSSMSD